jgi:hypothetical protein
LGEVLEEVKEELRKLLETATRLNEEYNGRLNERKRGMTMEQVLKEFGGPSQAPPELKRLQPKSETGPQKDSDGRFK